VENTSAVATYTANELVTWSLNGGADSARFTLSGGVLSFVSAPDFEAPSDANTDNVYSVVIRATDIAGNTADQSVTVTVTDADEIAPEISGPIAPSVVENTTAVATYTANEVVTWSLNGGADVTRFTLNAGVLAFASAPDFEAPTDANADNIYNVVIRATDSAGNTADQSLTVTVTDADEIPPVIAGQVAPSVVENTTAVATYIANEPVTWSLNGGVDADRFTLDGGSLTFVSAPDFEAPVDANTDNTYLVVIRATDAAGNTADQPITVTVTDADEIPPVIAGQVAPSVVENTTVITTYTANEVVTWSLNGGADAARFTFSGGVLSFVSAPDFEAPTDANTDNVYSVVVRATDTAGNTADQSVTVTVTDADEIAPEISGPIAPSVVENTTAVATYTANEAVTWSLNGGADSARFTLSGGVLDFASAPDFEAPTDANTDNIYNVVIRATDIAGNTTDQSLTVTVTDADEIPPVIAGQVAPSVVENTTVITTYTANEPVTWSLNGGADAARFTLNGGVLAFASAPDFEAPTDANTDNVYSVVIRATDIAGNTADQSE
jgi:flagellar basal body-associated protein FliL